MNKIRAEEARTEPILVLGKNGQLARSLSEVLPNNSIFWDRNKAPLENPQLITRAMEDLRLRPRAVICTSAFTAVDRAESEVDLCFQINAKAPAHLSLYCADHNIPFIWYSSDYVFDGTKTTPYTTDDQINPINVYGESKANGEAGVRKNGGHVIRTSWVMSPYSKNFLKTIANACLERSIIKIVHDQTGCPTLASSLAEFTSNFLVRLESKKIKTDGSLWHWCDGPITSWLQIGKKIRNQIAQDFPHKIMAETILPITTKTLNLPAKRPQYSALSTVDTQKEFGSEPKDFFSELTQIIAQILGT